MSDYSDRQENPFNSVRQRNVATFVSIAAKSKIATLDYLKRRYLEQAPDFEATLGFLKGLGELKVDSDQVRLSKNLKKSAAEGEHGVRVAIIRRLLESSGPYRNAIIWHLHAYSVVDGVAQLQPSTDRTAADNSVRTYLIDLGVIFPLANKPVYKLNADFNFLLADAREQLGAVSPKQLHSDLAMRNSVAKQAELFVFQYEQARVGEEYKNRVMHVAEFNEAAGYDIRSMTFSEDGQAFPRCIEVKAVSSADYGFFWTSNERTVADRLREWYYLYLVPVHHDGAVAVEELIVLPDPAQSVLMQSSRWHVVDDVVHCSLQR